MSRWILALAAISLAFPPVRAAEPKPLWEIDTFPNGKLLHEVRWVGYAPNGKTLLAQVADGPQQFERNCSLLFAWDVAAQKEMLKLNVCEHVYPGSGMPANATTKVGSFLLRGSAEEVRLADGERVVAKDLPGQPVGVWFNLESSDCLWLSLDKFKEYRLSYGKMPPLVANPNKAPAREQWQETKLPGDWAEDPPIVAVNFDLTRLAFSSREGRKLKLCNIAVDDKLKLSDVASVPTGHRGAISTLLFSPDSKTLATGSWDASICLWDITKAGKDWKPQATISAGTFTVSALTFSPDGRTLTAGTFDKRVANLYLIDVNAGKVVASYRLGNEITALAYSPDGKKLVTGDSRGGVKVWNAGVLRHPD